VAGTAMQYKAQRDASKRQQRQIGLQEDRNDKSNKKVIQNVQQLMGQYDPDARAQNQQQAQQDSEISLTDFLNESNASRDDGNTTGRVSEVYSTEKAKRITDQAEVAANMARLMSKMRAPTDSRMNEQLNYADTAARVGGINQNRGNMANAAGVDIRQAGNPNPFLMAMGSGMQSYGAYRGTGASQPKPTPKTYRT